MKKYNYTNRHPLDDSFTAGGFVFEKLMMGQSHCLYEVSSPEDGYRYWEMFELKEYKPGVYGSNTLKDGEYYYPLTEDFGRWAWCYSSKDKAVKEFRRMEQGR